MLEDLIDVLKQTKNLVDDKDKFYAKLQEALDIVQAIKQGNIDAVFMVNHETAKVLVSKTDDQTYRKFIENMREGVVTLLHDGTILYSNSRFAQIVDTPLEKVIGSNLRNHIPVKYIETFERFFDGFPFDDTTANISLSDQEGVDKYYIVSFQMLPLQNLLALNMVWTDITELTTAKEQLIDTNEKLELAIREKIISETKTVVLNNKLVLYIEELRKMDVEFKTFAQVASLGLQEHLKILSTYSSILVRDYFHTMDPQGRGYVNIMIDATVRMHNMVNDIVEYSELSQSIAQFDTINLQQIVSYIIINMDGLLRSTHAQIIIRKELPIIEANGPQMLQLFQNILGNALKFIDPGTQPEINIWSDIIQSRELKTSHTLQPDQKLCRIYVSSNGIGFDPRYNDEVFGIFQRLKSNRELPGTGIGLAMCKRIVAQHYGSITAEGTPGKGSLITIILPVSQQFEILA